MDSGPGPASHRLRPEGGFKETPNTAHEGDGRVAYVPTWDRESRCEIVRIPALGEPGRGAQPFSFRERNYQKEC
jgi:hypothetical protein